MRAKQKKSPCLAPPVVGRRRHENIDGDEAKSGNQQQLGLPSLQHRSNNNNNKTTTQTIPSNQGSFACS
jgi:hypothetical protein